MSISRSLPRGQSALPGFEPELLNGKVWDLSTVDYYFERFWAAYPRRIAKPVAERSFRNAMEAGVNPQVMAAGLQAWIAYWQHENRPQFIPHPSTWLNQQRWNDEPPVSRNTHPGVDYIRRQLADLDAEG